LTFIQERSCCFVTRTLKLSKLYFMMEQGERLWRSIKYENMYLKGYQTMKEAEAGIAEYIEFYNLSRLHESLDYRTPHQVHEGVYKAKEIVVGKKVLKAAA